MRRRSGELTSREKRFCEVYSLGGDAAAAAVDAGYDMPEKAGVSLLSRDDINNEVSRLYEKRLRNARQKAYAGYERIAFGSVNDAVRLLFEGDAFTAGAEDYDLFNVAEKIDEAHRDPQEQRQAKEGHQDPKEDGQSLLSSSPPEPLLPGFPGNRFLRQLFPGLLPDYF